MSFTQGRDRRWGNGRPTCEETFLGGELHGWESATYTCYQPPHVALCQAMCRGFLWLR